MTLFFFVNPFKDKVSVPSFVVGTEAEDATRSMESQW
jgi:hypothetical protein